MDFSNGASGHKTAPESTLFKKGQVLFVEGGPSESFFLIKSGEVKVFKESKGGLFFLGVCGDRDFVGEARPFAVGKRHASAIATQDVEAHVFRKSDVIKVVRSYPKWIEQVIETLSKRLCATLDMMMEHRVIYTEEEEGASMTEEELFGHKRAFEEYKRAHGLSHQDN